MSDKKHIDRLFQEKLKDFEATPSDAVWDSIHDRLHKDKRKRRVIPIWWRVAGVAALLTLLITVGVKLTSNDLNSDAQNPIVDTEKLSQDDFNNAANSNNSNGLQDSVDNASNVSTENDSDLENTSDANSDANNLKKFQSGNDNSNVIANENGSSAENTSSKSNNRTSEKIRMNQKSTTIPKSNKDRVANTDNSNRNNSQEKTNKTPVSNGVSEGEKSSNSKNVVLANSKDSNDSSDQKNLGTKAKTDLDELIEDSKKNPNSQLTDATEQTEDIISEVKKEDTKAEQSIEEAIAEATTEEVKEKETKMNRWNISPNVAPVYFNSFGSGSTLDDQFVKNEKSSEITLSYGVGGSYAINDRFKVRAGINKVDMGYSTNNVIAFRTIDPSSQTRSSDLSNVSMNSEGDAMTYLSTESLNKNITPEIINSKSEGSLNQRFGFIEVPMEVEYALINKKLGINVIGGFSTLIVNENEIYSVVDGTETRIGEASNINDLSYSANVGFGINYNISEKIKVNVEPTFKYQINTFSKSSGDVQPYFIGVYTGLSYKF